ncbi:MAG: CARDB domain-containing protein, partial [Candidatus Bathyarchaeia archaeon]
MSVPSNKPIPNGDYLWWALVFDGRGWSETSEKRRIKISGQVVNYPPSVPTLISPSDGSTVSPTPIFKLRAYDPEGDDVKYCIELSSSNSARTYETSFFISGQEATYTVPHDSPLSPGQWVWRAKAIDSKGAQSEWSRPRTFIVNIANNAPSKPILLSPVNQTVSPVPTFRLKSNDADNDKVMFIIEVKQGRITKIFQTGFYASGEEATYSDQRQPLSDGQWKWRAMARDMRNAESDWSDEVTFTVTSSAPDLLPKEFTISTDKITPGGKLQVRVVVINRGNKRSNPCKTRIRLSQSASQPSPNDPILAQFDTPALDPNESVKHEEKVTIPSDTQSGNYHVWVIVDADRSAGQVDETNDRVSRKLTVQAQVDYDFKIVDGDTNKPLKNTLVNVVIFDDQHIVKYANTLRTRENGELKVPELKDLLKKQKLYVRVEKYVTTFYLDEQEQRSETQTNRKFYDVYITSDEVKNDGTIDNEIKSLPMTLTIRKQNVLIKFHLELAFEWDADKRTVDFWIEALRHASNLLYDVTDGHACIGSVKVRTNYRYPSSQQTYTGVPRNAIQVFADNEVRPHVSAIHPGRGISGVHIGREWQGKAGDWRKIQPELLGSILAHEFGHSLLLLPDEYEPKSSKPKCVTPEIEQKDLYGHWDDFRSAVACLMASPFEVEGAEAWMKASELCNGRPNRHTAKDMEGLIFEEENGGKVIKKKLEKDCWTRFKENFERHSKGRWVIRTPFDRGVDVVPGPVRVVSYTLSSTQGKGRLIDVKDRKDLIGNEMEVKSLVTYEGGRKVTLTILRMPEKKPADVRVGIYTSNKFVYQGRTKDGKISIEGYHPGEIVDIFAYDKLRLIGLSSGNEITVEFCPTDYLWKSVWRIEVGLLALMEKRLDLIVKIPQNVGSKEVKNVFVQIIVQDGVVLNQREIPLKFDFNKSSVDYYAWTGSILLLPGRNRFLEPILNLIRTEGYFRLGYETMDGKKSAAAAWGAFGHYSLSEPYPIVGDTLTMRLVNGLGYLEAPKAKDETVIGFVATTPFIFNQANLIPRSFAYTFGILTGDLGDNSKLYLTFEPIPEMPEGKVLRLYQFSEETKQWQPIEAEVNLAEGVAIVSPARAGTYAVMEETPSPPSFTFPAGLRMIGIPFRPYNPSPTDVFGLTANAMCLARWNAKERSYTFYRSDEREQDPEVAFIMPGKGYWVKFDSPVTIPQQGGLLPEEGIAIGLKAGWNQIANPFLRPLNWSVDEIYVRGSNDEVKPLSEAVKAGWIEDYAWGWEQDKNDPFKGKYVLVYDTSIIPGVKGQLEPWKGYWVYA